MMDIHSNFFSRYAELIHVISWLCCQKSAKKLPFLVDVLGQVHDLGEVFTWFVVFVSHALTTLSFKLCLEKGRRSTHKTCRHVFVLADTRGFVACCRALLHGNSGGHLD